jgi:putative transcriptional regulator
VSEIRQQLGVTQAEFAKMLGVSLESVKSWEIGRRHPSGLAAGD